MRFPFRLRSFRILTAVAFCIASGAFAQKAGEVKRTVLQRHDTTAPGFEAVLVQVDIPAGGREGRHTHPGVALILIEQGTLTVDYEGKPTTQYKAGESLVVEAGKVHEGVNKGNTPVRAIAAFVIAKGAALTTAADASR